MTGVRLNIRSRNPLIDIGVLFGATLLLSLEACAPQVEVAPSDEPITINLDVKVDHGIRQNVEKDLDAVISDDSGFLWTTSPSSGSPVALDEAKARGLVGEMANGYLGLVHHPTPETQPLVASVNEKRRQAYGDIAKRNRTTIEAVEGLAGEKAIKMTLRGHFIEGPGGWIKK